MGLPKANMRVGWGTGQSRKKIRTVITISKFYKFQFIYVGIIDQEQQHDEKIRHNILLQEENQTTLSWSQCNQLEFDQPLEVTPNSQEECANGPRKLPFCSRFYLGLFVLP